MTYDDESAHLNLLAVAPQARRRGIGRSLLDWLEAPALAAGLGLVKAEVRRANAGARRFYVACGYGEREVLARYYSGLEDAVRLEKRLGAAPAGA